METARDTVKTLGDEEEKKEEEQQQQRENAATGEGKYDAGKGEGVIEESPRKTML